MGKPRYRNSSRVKVTQLLINGDYRNDAETNELLASDVMRHFA
jgi:hypothetical protein